MSRPDHPIFKGPLPVEMEIEQTPTPDHYHTFGFEDTVPETLPTVDILTEVGEVGLVTTDAGFLDSPDTEIIAGGIHSKGPDYVAIGRQGNFLLWGFHGSPAEMTEAGRLLFLNAIAYISKFADAPVEALRETRPRDSLGISLSFLHRYPEARRPGHLTHLFGEEIPEALRGAGKEECKAWFDTNRPYVRYDGKAYRVDEDCKAMGIPNNDIAILDRCVKDLRKEEEAQRALRILGRYTDLDLERADAWGAWLEENRDRLYFTDWGGYRFRVYSKRMSSR